MGGDDKANNFDRSWLQRANQLIENTGRHGGPPKRRETPRDWREGAGATPEPEPEPKPKPPTDQLRTSTPPPGAPSTTRKSQGLHALLNRCSLVADKTLGGWFETREMSGSAGTEEETPVGRTIEHDGGEFAPISCPESTKRWRAEYRRRIEHAFATSLADATTSEDEEIAIGDGSAEEKSAFLLNLLAISLCEYGFDARTAAVMDGLSTSLGMSREDYARAVEGLLAEQLKKGYLREQQDLNAQSTAAGRLKKKMLVGLGAVSGGVALGLTAGLAAPVVLPALAAVFGAAYLAGATATTLFIAVFGVGGAGLTKYKVERRYLDIKDFEFVPVAVAVRMRVAIGISGWIREEEDVTLPWTNLASLTIDVYAIRCQIEAFQELGSALKTIMTNAAVKYAAVGVIKTTALSAAVAAMMWPAAVLQVAKLIDNPWSVCANIAEREGLILADALKKRVHGRRPVTLCGFSLGALTICTCLLELSKDPDANLGIIHNVVLCGAPVKIAPVERWCRMRMLVAGRFIHGYSRNDWILQYLHRSTSLTVGDIAGLNPIEDVDGIENVDLSEVVKGHLEYSERIPQILTNLAL